MINVIKRTTLLSVLSLGAAHADTVVLTAVISDDGEVLDTVEIVAEVPATTQVEDDGTFAQFLATSYSVFSTKDQTTTAFTNLDPEDFNGFFLSVLPGDEEFDGATAFSVFFALPDLSIFGGVDDTFVASFENSFAESLGAPTLTGNASDISNIAPVADISFGGGTLEPTSSELALPPGEALSFEVVSAVVISEDNAEVENDGRARRDRRARRPREDRPRRERRERR